LRQHLPWLAQGDIFLSVPIPDVALDDDGEIAFHIWPGPAVLLTHDCQIDKRTNAGVPRMERFQFARLRTFESQALERQQNLRARADKVEPTEVLVVGEVPGLGEAFMLLSEPHYLPTMYFGGKFVDYAEHEDATGNDRKFLTPTGKHDTRICRLDDPQIELLRLKMQGFWSRTQPPG
jgi:hypothetical protein